MKIKLKYFTYIMIVFFSSCQSQSRMDLSELTLSEDLLVMIPKSERTLFSLDKVDPATGTPAFTTYEVQKYRYKNIEFKQPELGHNQVTFYTYKALKEGSDNQISGFSFDLEDRNEELFTILKKQYGKPEELTPVPTYTLEEVLHGHNSFVWRKNEISIILSYSYSSLNDKQRIRTTVYIINNDAKDLTFPEQISVNRLIETHKQR